MLQRVGGAFLSILLVASTVRAQVQTTIDNFFQRGSPPITYGLNMELFTSSDNCNLCHEVEHDVNNYSDPIYQRWRSSMMGNAGRDPLFHAALTVANQDAAFSGDVCIRCHMPIGWLEGRSTPTDGSALIEDFDVSEGVSCNFCHRMIDPVLAPDHPTPPEGDDIIRVILQNEGLLPIRPGGGNYVIDPADSRRGPFPFEEGCDPEVDECDPTSIRQNLHFTDFHSIGEIPIIESAYHRSSDLCGTCHDVSNPAFVKQPDGSYSLNTLGEEHPTGDPYDMFPIERTYSEWLNSTYATTGVDAGGVFGGNHETGVMRTCQDCHMPAMESYGCAFTDSFPLRSNVPAHEFNGGNAWIPDVLKNLYPAPLLNPLLLDETKDRAVYMLENAATLDVTEEGCNLRVRVTNETGHKLPSGYPEGRRIWIEVDFRDAGLSEVVTRGHYDAVTADLTTADTKVYEIELGLDGAVAGATGLDEGPSFHFALNNKAYKDNRIPPRGFTNAAYEAFGGAPVGVTYADGQYWDDTVFRIPPGATSATVSLYYQTASKEYITFLRDENHTNDAGDILYEQWELTGKSSPVLMAEMVAVDLSAGMFADADCSGTIGLGDHALLGDCLSGPNSTLSLGCEAFDGDLDSDTDLSDVAAFQRAFTGP